MPNVTRTIAWLCLAVLSLAACTRPDASVAPSTAPLPQRVVLHYDFAGDWAATAGDACAERLDLSQGVFLTIAGAADRSPAAFHVARFFMIEEAERAEALVGTADETGRLSLTVETEGVIDGRAAAITYDLRLEPDGPRRVWLTAFAMTVRDRTGEAARADLLARAATDPTIPVLSEAGERGLCLKRL